MIPSNKVKKNNAKPRPETNPIILYRSAFEKNSAARSAKIAPAKMFPNNRNDRDIISANLFIASMGNAHIAMIAFAVQRMIL